MIIHRLTSYSDLSNSLALEVFAVRKAIFCDQLGWDIKSDGKYERDQHDLPQTNILVSTTTSNQLAGFARLLSLDEGCMLDDVLPFPDLDFNIFKGFYEISRFFLIRNRSLINAKITCSDFFRELILSAGLLGAKGYLAAVDAKMLSCLDRSGWKYSHVSSRLGSIGEVVYLVSLPIDRVALESVSYS